MGDLEVDIDGLEALVGSLGQVRDGLDDTKAVIEASEDALGSGDVVDALFDFEDHWEDGRGRVRENIEAIVGAVRDSAEAYRQTDDDLRDALTEEKA